MILAIAFAAVILVMMVLMPLLLDTAPMMKSVYDYFVLSDIDIIDGACVFWIWYYSVSAVAVFCCVTVTALLFRVRKRSVFSETSVAMIRLSSWSCLLIALLCILVIGYFHMAAVLALAAGFLGLCLRVVKNVIEEATLIKSENDLTV